MKCPKCPHSTFSSQDELDGHIYKCHRKESLPTIKYKCLLCSKKYSNRATLVQHQKTCRSVPSTSSCQGSYGTESVDDTSQAEVPTRTSPDVYDDEPTGDDEVLDEIVLDSNGSESKAVSGEASAEELLQHSAAAFLSHLKNECYTTQHTVNELISGVNVLKEVFLEVVEEKFSKEAGAASVLTLEDALKIIRSLKGFSLFAGAEDIESFQQDQGGLVLPRRVDFGDDSSQPTLRAGNLIQDIPIAYEVPFLQQLERLLNIPEVLYCIDNPREFDGFIYRTVLDGHFYRNHPVYLKDRKALAIILYGDGVELVDTASARAGKHNLTNVYWTLANIYPELRSSDRVINLLATIYSSDLDQVALERILAGLNEGLRRLALDEGVTFIINGTPRIFHGLLLMVTGDFPAQAKFGGFKGSVKAKKPCRQCLVSKEDHLIITDPSLLQLRDRESHEMHVTAVEAYNSSTVPVARRGEDPSVKFGVNYRSPLQSAPGFDLTKCLVQDMMHNGPEGIAQLVAKEVINDVKDSEKMTLEDINKRIDLFGKVFRRDRPSPRNTEEHLRKNLRQSSAQMLNLTILLPFILRTQNEESRWAYPGEAAFLDLLLQFVRIMNLCMAYELTLDDADRLKEMISDFHESLLKLLPNLSMSKVHFIHHLAMQILFFGVLRQQACFRFEGHHAFFKRMCRIIHNFVNILSSLSHRHQTKQNQLMMNPNFLYKGHTYSVKSELPVNVVDRNINLIKNIFPQPSKLVELRSLDMHGTHYKSKGDCLILTSDIVDQPQFGKILHIYMIDDKKFGFVCQLLKTISKRVELNAYEVIPSGSKMAIDADKLLFPHEIISLKVDGEWLVTLQGHRVLCT